VDSIFKLFDRFTNLIPASMIKMIRLLALFLWVIGATVAGYISWIHGRSSTPESGQDLYLVDIKEKIQREQNMAKAPAITVPNLNDLVSDDKLPDMSGLSSSGLSPSEEKKEEILPPFLSESDASVYPRTNYLPGKDAGSPGTRPVIGEDSPLLPVKGPKAEQKSMENVKKNITPQIPEGKDKPKMEKPAPDKKIRDKGLLPME